VPTKRLLAIISFYSLKTGFWREEKEEDQLRADRMKALRATEVPDKRASS